MECSPPRHRPIRSDHLACFVLRGSPINAKVCCRIRKVAKESAGPHLAFGVEGLGSRVSLLGSLWGLMEAAYAVLEATSHGDLDLQQACEEASSCRGRSGAAPSSGSRRDHSAGGSRNRMPRTPALKPERRKKTRLARCRLVGPTSPMVSFGSIRRSNWPQVSCRIVRIPSSLTGMSLPLVLVRRASTKARIFLSDAGSGRLKMLPAPVTRRLRSSKCSSGILMVLERHTSRKVDDMSLGFLA